MYISVPRPHHVTALARGARSLLVVEPALLPLVRDAMAGTGLTIVGTVEGQGFGTLGRYQ